MPDEPEIDAYLQVADAEELLAGLVDTAAWTAAAETNGLQTAALIQASDEIDTVRFAGVPYADYSTGVAGTQARAFPRYVMDPAADWPAGKALASGRVWDWDATTAAAVVPNAVKLATFLQAISILRDAHRPGRLRDRHDGVASQSAGGVSESYDLAKAPKLVCLEAMARLRPYLLRSGRIV